MRAEQAQAVADQGGPSRDGAGQPSRAEMGRHENPPAANDAVHGKMFSLERRRGQGTAS